MGINTGRDYFLLDFAFSARILAHLAFCVIAILRLPAADIFPRGALLADPDFVLRHVEAEPLFLQTLRVFNEKDASGSSAGIALNGLGLVRNARGLYQEAIPYFEQALQIFERVHGPDFTDCATALRNMALSLQHTGDDRRAEEALKRARRIKG